MALQPWLWLLHGVQDESCGVWQHCDCLGIPAGALPEAWLCEQCRLARADPFWRRVGPPPMPAQVLAPTHPHRAFGDGLKYTEDVQQVGPTGAPRCLSSCLHARVLLSGELGCLSCPCNVQQRNPISRMPCAAEHQQDPGCSMSAVPGIPARPDAKILKPYRVPQCRGGVPRARTVTSACRTRSWIPCAAPPWPTSCRRARWPLLSRRFCSAPVMALCCSSCVVAHARVIVCRHAAQGKPHVCQPACCAALWARGTHLEAPRATAARRQERESPSQPEPAAPEQRGVRARAPHRWRA